MPWVVVCYTAMHFYSHGLWDLPVCSGSLVPIDFKIPDGTVLSPAWDAAISHAPHVGENINELMPKFSACMMFSTEDRDLIDAPLNGAGGGGGGGAGIGFGFGGSGVNQFGVQISGGGGGWTRNTMGQGGRVDMDGMDSSLFRSAVHASGSDAEDAEADHPVLHLWQKHRKDSPGPGKHRGGATGYVSTIYYGVPSAKRGASAGSQGRSRRMLIGQGLFGGYPCCGIPGASILNSNILQLMEKGEKNIPTSPEQILKERLIEGEYIVPGSNPPRPAGYILEGSFSGGGSSGGGHGYGDVLEREPQAVVNDVRDEIISDWAARNVYCVAYDTETLIADDEKTTELRQHARSDRLCQAKRYEEFEKGWLKKKPPEDMLNYYGSWPDAKLVKPIIRI